MEIRKRVGLPRMSFHVMNRGARKAVIFRDDGDRRAFVGMMGSFCVKYGIKLTSWSLMPNHYHLEPDAEGTPLTHTMRDLDGTYAREFNERYAGSGALFQGPFKSMSISDDVGLAFVSRYIHLNPRDIGADPLTYPWSSLGCYLGWEPVPDWLDPMPVLRQFGDTLEEARANYRFYLSSAPPKRRKAPWGEDPQDDFLVEYVAHLEEECAALLKRENLTIRPVEMPSFVCWYANRLEGVPFRVLAEYFEYSSAGCVRALVSRFARRLSRDEELARWLGKVNVSATRKR